MMRLQKALWAAPILFVWITAPLLGHHGLAQTFDMSKATTIQGVIRKIEWMSPHVWITLESKDASGAITSWHVEIAAPNAMFRAGIRREDFELAKSCSIEVWPARDGSKTANGRKLTFVDGKTLDIHDRFGEFPPPATPVK